MTARRKPIRSSKRPNPAADKRLYLGCFFFDNFGDRDHVGTFQVVIEASSPDDAVKRLRKRLKAIRDVGSILTGTYTIYLEGLVQLDGSFNEGLMVNYESRPSDAPPDCQLLNFMPEQGRPTPGSYRIGKDETKDEPFLDFGGKAHLRGLKAANNGDSLPVMPPKPRLSFQEKEEARAEIAAKKSQRRAKAQARKKERQVVAEAKQRRDRLLKETLAELSQRAQADQR
jgi:hypothetical protein